MYVLYHTYVGMYVLFSNRIIIEIDSINPLLGSRRRVIVYCVIKSFDLGYWIVSDCFQTNLI